MATTAPQARLIVPQLRFSQAHDVPLYATSYVYAGNPDPAMDADLDGLIFGEMRWILDGVALYKQQTAQEKARKAAEAGNSPDDSENPSPDPDTLEESPDNGVTTPDLFGENDPFDDSVVDPDLNPAQPETEIPEEEVEPPWTRQSDLPEHPYARTTLDRLYALGVQSYQIIPRLRVLRQNSWMRLSGKAMTIRVDPNGNAVHLPVWARFESGLAEPLPAASGRNNFLNSVRPGKHL